MSPPNLDFLPTNLKSVAQMAIVAGALVIGGIYLVAWLEGKASAAAETKVERIERKIDRVGCMMEVHVGPKPTADDYAKCALMK